MRISAGRRRAVDQQRSLQLTAMIDIVFLLLVFFVMTFRVVAPEGDLALALPDRKSIGDDGGLLATDRVLQIRLTADADEELSGIVLDNRPLRPADGNSLIDALRARVRNAVEAPREVDTEVSAVIHCEPTLKYRFLLQAITAVSGYRDGPGPAASIIPLVDSVQLGAPPD
jgi:biopolymer transport protein ExbD